MIRILVADDHALVRAGLIELLKKLNDVEVVGEAGEGLEALRLAHSLSPDIALMDIAMPGLNGIAIAEKMAVECPNIRVILLSMFGTEAYLRKALQAKVSGYLLKGADIEELRLAIHTVSRGDVYLMPAIAKHLANAVNHSHNTPEAELACLTLRQREILQFIVEGCTAKEIAFRLKLSTKTVDAHRANLMRKLAIHDVPGLVYFAIRTGLIPDGRSELSGIS